MRTQRPGHQLSVVLLVGLCLLGCSPAPSPTLSPAVSVSPSGPATAMCPSMEVPGDLGVAFLSTGMGVPAAGTDVQILAAVETGAVDLGELALVLATQLSGPAPRRHTASGVLIVEIQDPGGCAFRVAIDDQLVVPPNKGDPAAIEIVTAEGVLHQGGNGFCTWLALGDPRSSGLECVALQLGDPAIAAWRVWARLAWSEPLETPDPVPGWAAIADSGTVGP